MTDPPQLVLGRLGALLLDTGASVVDVRTALERVAAATGVGGLAIGVLPQMVLVNDVDTGRSTAVNAAEQELTLHQAAQANRLVGSLEDGRVGLEAVGEEIATIRAYVRRHARSQWVAGNLVVAGALAALLRCPWWAVVAAAGGGGMGGVLTAWAGSRRGAAAIAPFVTALVATSVVGALASALDLGAVPLFAVCAPVAILVPGALITNALLELTAGDVITGSARLAYGLVVLGFMSAGIAAGAALTGLRLDRGSAALVGDARGVTSTATGWGSLPPVGLSWVAVVLLAVGLGLAFGSGIRLTLLTVVVMSSTYAMLTVATPAVGGVLATGMTAGVLFIVGRLVEQRTRLVPAAVLFLPAFLLLVPGTVGLVALSTLEGAAIGDALRTFASLCIGTHAGALLADLLGPLVRGRGEPTGPGVS